MWWASVRLGPVRLVAPDPVPEGAVFFAGSGQHGHEPAATGRDVVHGGPVGQLGVGDVEEVARADGAEGRLAPFRIGAFQHPDRGDPLAVRAEAQPENPPRIGAVLDGDEDDGRNPLLGNEVVEWLKGPHEPVRYRAEDYLRIIEEYKAKIKLLGKPT